MKTLETVGDVYIERLNEIRLCKYSKEVKTMGFGDGSKFPKNFNFFKYKNKTKEYRGKAI